ncbi:hypothetical protein QBC40DRAFT_280968 [Triangularia verruculosa]|uniref:RING-type domain-containing protein n=1 Tax=Triangularia verruculosa TaxID=2587418 RepID=A0AAN6XHW7_9PEZI|nr:hypothetical protein QBC40DRAFT_280968 [Triangularia verruculosa]
MSPGSVPSVQIVAGRPWPSLSFDSLVGPTSFILLSLLLLLQTLLPQVYPNTMGKKGASYDRKGGPTVVETEKKIDATDPESSCPICCDPIGTENPEGQTEGWSELPCGHRFGSHCIKHYLGIVADDRPACPICRQVAYHLCGHPVLPMLCAGTASKSKTTARATLTLTDLAWRYCGYCEKAGLPRTVVKQSRLWRPFRVIVDALNPRRRRERRRQPREYPLYTPSPWVPFARMPDPGWEKWWRAQAPAEA